MVWSGTFGQYIWEELCKKFLVCFMSYKLFLSGNTFAFYYHHIFITNNNYKPKCLSYFLYLSTQLLEENLLSEPTTENKFSCSLLLPVLFVKFCKKVQTTEPGENQRQGGRPQVRHELVALLGRVM